MDTDKRKKYDPPKGNWKNLLALKIPLRPTSFNDLIKLNKYRVNLLINTIIDTSIRYRDWEESSFLCSSAVGGVAQSL